MTPLTAGRVARRLLAFYQNDPKKWTQGWLAKTASGGTTGPTKPNAVCFCALGALYKIMKIENDWSPRFQEAVEVLAAALGRQPQVFNDRCVDFEEFKTRLHKIARLP